MFALVIVDFPFTPPISRMRAGHGENEAIVRLVGYEYGLPAAARHSVHTGYDVSECAVSPQWR